VVGGGSVQWGSRSPKPLMQTKHMSHSLIYLPTVLVSLFKSFYFIYQISLNILNKCLCERDYWWL